MKRKLSYLTLLVCALLMNPGWSAQEPTLIDIDFEGGPVWQFLERIEEFNINTMVPENASEVLIPPFSLRNTTIENLFQALSIAGSNAPVKFAWISSNRDMPLVLVNQNRLMGIDRGNITWVLTVLEPTFTVQPLAIGHLLHSQSNPHGYTMEQITSVIQSTVDAAAKAANRASALDFKYHESTELLIVTGVARDLRLTHETLGAMYQSLQAKQARDSQVSIYPSTNNNQGK